MDTTTTIDQLDENSLSNIFDYLSNQDIWYAGLLCPQLKIARTQSTRFRPELALLIGKDAKRYIDKSGLTIPERRLLIDDNGDVMFPETDQNVQLQIYAFPVDFARILLSNFTHLTTLTISTRIDGNELVPIIHLLEQFNPQNGQTLHTLKLYLDCHNLTDRNIKLKQSYNKNENPSIRHGRLLSAVNSIGTLRILTFDVNLKFGQRPNYDSRARIDLPILAQLEEVEFNSADDDYRCLHDAIMAYAVNNHRLRRIGIHNSQFHFALAGLLSLPTEFATRFTHFHFGISNDNLYFSNVVLRRFVNITSLECTFMVEDLTIARLLRPLAQLQHLLSLVISVYGVNTKLGSRLMPAGFALPSVKVLILNFISCYTNDHHARHNFFRYLLNVFPNVQVVRVTMLRPLCDNCERLTKKKKKQKKFTLWSEASVARLEEHCARYMFRHFDYCRHLRIVSSKVVGDSQVAGPRYREWAWNEMPPFESEAQVLKRIVDDAKESVQN